MQIQAAWPKRRNDFQKSNWQAGLRFGKRALNILVTAGGTKENIDPVRYIGNFSTGSFGRAFAREAAKRGHHVTLLAPKSLPKLVGQLGKGIDFRPFRSVADLQALLKQAASERPWDIVIHSAAVSDYTPAEAVSHKISSNQDELLIRLVPTPKLIQSFRQCFGRAFLVGFKLLTGASREEAHRISLAQVKKNRTNLAIYNDFSQINPKQHHVHLATPEGGFIPVQPGKNSKVAKHVLDFIEKRQAVRWFQTVQDPTLAENPKAKDLGRLVSLAQASGLLNDENGNASVRLPNHRMAITPRSVDKGKLTEKDFLLVKVDQRKRRVYVNSPTKPSIDSSVSDALYKAYPGLKAILHTHSPWVLNPYTTSFPYPCGVKEEAQEALKTLKQHHHANNKAFVLKLLHHGTLLGLAGDLDIATLEAQWQAVQKDFKAHMQEIGIADTALAQGRVQAILSPEGIVGYVFTDTDGTIAPRLLPEHQGKGLGRQLLEVIRAENKTVKTVQECDVLAYYQKYGFELTQQDGRFYFLKPVAQSSSKDFIPFKN